MVPTLVQGGKCQCECLFVKRHRRQAFHYRDERAQSPPDDGLDGGAVLTHRSQGKSCIALLDRPGCLMLLSTQRKEKAVHYCRDRVRDGGRPATFGRIW